MEEKTLKKIREQISHAGEMLENRINKRPQKYGLCSKCANFHYRKTIYENEIAYCLFQDRKTYLPSVDRIKECVDFYPYDQMDLYDMLQIAHIIEIKKEKKIGFRND